MLGQLRNQAQANISISDMVKAGSEAKAIMCYLQSTGGESGRRPEAGDGGQHTLFHDLDLEANTSSLCALLVKAKAKHLLDPRAEGHGLCFLTIGDIIAVIFGK